jgi:hypothetical protein
VWVSKFDRILDKAPAMFIAAQLNVTDEEASREDVRPASLSSTCIRRDYRWTPHIESF